MAEESEKPKGNIKKFLGLAFIVINFVVVGGGAYLAYAGTLGYRSPALLEADLNKEMIQFQESLAQPPILYTMDPFNTNLDGLPRQFIRVQMSIEMYDKGGFEELVTLGGRGRDAILRILNSKRYQDVDSVQGKLQLKNDIIAYLNKQLKHGVVKNIYFTKFQVQ